MSLSGGIVNEFILDSFTKLCHGNVPPGLDYARAVTSHARELAALYLQADSAAASVGKTVVVAIPRGGIPTGLGAREAFNAASHAARMVDSRIKADPASLFPAGTFDKTGTLVLADGVIGTGKTIVDHLKQVPADWEGRIIILSNAAAQLGLTAIHAQAACILQPVAAITGRVFGEAECQWVQFPEKPVYFVGYNQKNGIDFKIPDVGDHIQPVTENPTP